MSRRGVADRLPKSLIKRIGTKVKETKVGTIMTNLEVKTKVVGRKIMKTVVCTFPLVDVIPPHLILWKT